MDMEFKFYRTVEFKEVQRAYQAKYGEEIDIDNLFDLYDFTNECYKEFRISEILYDPGVVVEQVAQLLIDAGCSMDETILLHIHW